MTTSSDRITANLPSADFGLTAAFYAQLGFEARFRNEAWMILTRGPLELEFFGHRADPRQSCFGACIRVRDLDALYAAFGSAGLPDDRCSIPRLAPPATMHGLRMFFLVDLDGSLLRCIEHPA